MTQNTTHTEIVQALTTAYGDIFTDVQEAHGVTTATVPLNQIYRIMTGLYKDQEGGFPFLTDICGVHYPEHKGRELMVVYHLMHMPSGKRLRLKVEVPLEDPVVPTMTGIWASANWMERETFDFYGIRFAGHPNLRRILNMDEMKEFPMRKEFPLEDPRRDDKMDAQFGRGVWDTVQKHQQHN